MGESVGWERVWVGECGVGESECGWERVSVGGRECGVGECVEWERVIVG